METGREKKTGDNQKGLEIGSGMKTRMKMTQTHSPDRQTDRETDRQTEVGTNWSPSHKDNN